MKKFWMACAALMMVACTTMAPPQRPMPHFAYKQYPPILLNVASIQVEDYTSTMQPGHVEHLMPQPLPAAVSEWARTRFKAVGPQGTATIVIKDASVVSRDLNRTTGLRGVFTVDQAERYDARLVVEMRVEGMGVGPDGNGLVNVERGQTISEKASVQDRDRLWTEMEEKMLIDLDAATMQMIQNRLNFAVLK